MIKKIKHKDHCEQPKSWIDQLFSFGRYLFRNKWYGLVLCIGIAGTMIAIGINTSLSTCINNLVNK